MRTPGMTPGRRVLCTLGRFIANIRELTGESDASLLRTASLQLLTLYKPSRLGHRPRLARANTRNMNDLHAFTIGCRTDRFQSTVYRLVGRPRVVCLARTCLAPRSCLYAAPQSRLVSQRLGSWRASVALEEPVQRGERVSSCLIIVRIMSLRRGGRRRPRGQAGRRGRCGAAYIVTHHQHAAT